MIERIKRWFFRGERHHREVIERLDRIAVGIEKLVEERRAQHAARTWRG